MKKQKREDWIMSFIGILMIIISIVGIIWFLRLMSNEKSEPLFPSDVPADVPLISGIIEASEQDFLVSYGTTAVKVEFNQVESIKHLWSGNNPKLIIVNPFSVSNDGETKTDTWDSVMLTQGYSLSSFTPWLTSSLIIDKKYYHQWINANAQLDILYPVFAPSGFTAGFTNKTASIEHPLRFFIISPEEYNIVRDIRRGSPDDYIIPIIFLVTCLLLPGILYILKSWHRKRS